MVEKKLVGKVTHFFPKVSVAVIKLSDALKIGDRISIEGRGQIIEQAVESMEVEHKKIPAAKKGDEIGMKVNGKAKEGDDVFKVLA
ncbi:MAG: translation elongation factor-like protein [Candidatus Aenigmatarchaeota archaeon]